MLQQIHCRCTTNSDLLLFKCSRGHRGLLCGNCLRTAAVIECPVCSSVLTVENTEHRYAAELPSPTSQDLSRTS
jgi:primosomal protein N'